MKGLKKILGIGVMGLAGFSCSAKQAGKVPVFAYDHHYASTSQTRTTSKLPKNVPGEIPGKVPKTPVKPDTSPVKPLKTPKPTGLFDPEFEVSGGYEIGEIDPDNKNVNYPNSTTTGFVGGAKVYPIPQVGIGGNFRRFEFNAKKEGETSGLKWKTNTEAEANAVYLSARVVPFASSKTLLDRLSFTAEHGWGKLKTTDTFEIPSWNIKDTKKDSYSFTDTRLGVGVDIVKTPDFAVTAGWQHGWMKIGGAGADNLNGAKTNTFTFGVTGKF